MNPIKFCKFHGFGNDYVVFEAEHLNRIENLNDFAQTVCHRHTGIGGDGIAVLRKLETDADYECRIINPDGSEAGFSGNGTRCAVAYLYYKNLWSAENLKLKTKSGIKNYQFLKRDENAFWFLAELGKPNFDLPENAFFKTASSETEENQPSNFSSLLVPDIGIICFNFVDVGNPVTVIFMNDFDEIDWRQAGTQIENFTAIFPEKTNVVFVKVLNKENIEIRIWERAAGETSSSGTCSIAAAVISATTGKTGRKVAVHAPGGMTEAVWREEDDEMLITGRADLAFCGEWIEEF